MAIPRTVLPGRTYFVTRRCLFRLFLLVPSKFLNHLFKFCLGYAASKFGIKVHLAVVLSNHYHLIVSDPHGLLPKFCHLLNSLLARVLNAYLGRSETFWAPGSYSAVALETPEDFYEKAGYLLANPVAAGLVERAVDWPGFITPPSWLLGKSSSRLHVRRPKFFFGERTDLPKDVEIEFKIPEMLGGVSPQEAVSRIEQQRARLEDAAHRKLASEGRSFLGRRAVLAQKPEERAKSEEPRFQISPTIACRCRWKRIEALQSLASWRREYERCRQRFIAGDREVLFPPGTWGPRVIYGALVRPAS